MPVSRLTPVFVAFSLATVALSACAPTSAGGNAPGSGDTVSGPRECFFTRNVTGFSAPDDQTLYLRVGVRDVYEMALFAPCPDIDWTHQLGVVSRSGSSVCRGSDATIISPGPLGAQRCMVRAVRKLTLTEVEALPKGRRP
ncbi:MAG: DUF6491 family protein [Phenylobacterium sp.]|uniref:DUF6491 family protein n=1 Tax=Phenylobacterium sp. TaxID=1871053 RepID=UPI0025F172AC|nr:DUF6491 family protein [Phenylobacterium sp.]MCG9917580.1 DUF6491 family protein [Phenylobacterium sp.]